MDSTAAQKISPATTAGSAVRVDIADMSNDHLRVCGWILGLATRIARAEIRYGDVVVDLLALGIAVPRPDVTEHFRGQVTVPDDAHGFYLSAELPARPLRSSYLRLWVQHHTGEISETVWPVSMGGPAAVEFFQAHGTTLAWLVQQVDPAEAALLRSWSFTTTAAASGEPPALMTSRLVIDVCAYVVPGVLLVIGRVDEPADATLAVSLTLGSRTFDLAGSLEFDDLQPSRASTHLRDQAPTERPFRAQLRIPPEIQAEPDAVIEVTGVRGTGRARRVLALDARAAHAEFAAYLRALEPDRALALLESLSPSIAAGAGDADRRAFATLWRTAVEALPISLEKANLGFLLHGDAALAIGASGVFLTGWLVAEEGITPEVRYHRGGISVRLDESWMRHPRTDVTTHLSAQGATVREDDHGFACFAEMPAPDGPAYLSATLGSGGVLRMRLPDITRAPPLQAVRSVLNSLNVTHRALKQILDTQVGPAVQTAWAQRPRVAPAVSVERFGPTPSSPTVSVIVPLYGRYDFADYQLALFADDPDFQSAELIYFVDDPGMFDAFRSQCHDLYQTYRVPFTLAFAGRNLGFAGANNAAASIARAPHLLLLNSDVMPKTPGWLGELVNLYAALKKPGLLGVKLLYEDGSVQHAGMVFRRYAPWGDLWINDHPYKGQTAAGLTGLRKVPAVTAACALVSAAVFQELGGLSEDYIVGDFEDSDFCLRAAAAGRRNWVSLDIELYHLERQSQDRIGDAHWRRNLTLYNCWQHDRRWSAQLEKLTR